MIDFSDLGSCEAVFRHFERIAGIPHGSGNTDKIADYLAEFAKERGLEHYRDEANNVIIKKPATEGYAHRPTVIIQGHHDMVAEKAPGCTKDMEKEGLELYRDGDLLKAKDTTLGGDDGIAVAYALALLDSKDIPHPALECVFTSDEEIGLLGAVALDGSLLQGRMLINVDSDEEGIFTVGCAGGRRCDLSLDLPMTEGNGYCYKLNLGGFKGGHSGVEIDKGRENGVKYLFTLLEGLEGIRLVKASGGNADNAIPRGCECLFLADRPMDKEIEEAFRELAEDICYIEPDIFYTLDEDKADSALSIEDTVKTVSLINTLPSGVMAMSQDIRGLVETSLNLGILRLEEGKLNVSFSVRSAKKAAKEAICRKLKGIADDFGCSYSDRGDYPAWEYRKDSHLRDVMTSVYGRLYGKEPQVVTIHAGLECGLFTEKLDGLDCVSLGPDNFDIHTTEERLSLSSSKRVWEFLLEVLKAV